MSHAPAYVVFAFTYVLIASRRLEWLPIGRPAGALVGAVLMVAVGALTPTESYAAIDHNTILLLFGMMLIAAYLERDGFFAHAAAWAVQRAASPWRLMLALSLLSAALSAVFVNDTVCVFLTPVVTAVCLRAGLPIGPYLIALATSANIGSAATLIGNPQNMIIGSLSGIPFTRFFLHCAPAAAAGMAVNLALLWVFYGRRLPPSAAVAASTDTPPPAPAARHAVILVGLMVAWAAGLHMAYATLTAAVAFVLLERRDPAAMLARVDWSLLVFFCGLFIVVAGLARTGLVEVVWNREAAGLSVATPGGAGLMTALVAAGSNLVSNVPVVMLLGPRIARMGAGDLGWYLTAFASTAAGNLTLIGSVANIIVAERAKPHHHLGFVEYLRFGFVSTVLVLAVGTAVILWTASF